MSTTTHQYLQDSFRSEEELTDEYVAAEEVETLEELVQNSRRDIVEDNHPRLCQLY